MNTNSLIHILILILFYVIILLRCEQDMPKKEISQTKRKLDTYGNITLYFDSQGSKFVFQVASVQFNDFNIYLKGDGNIVTLYQPDFTETEIISYKIYLENGYYYPIYVKYNSYSYQKIEIILEFKKKPTTLKGLFANSNADRITFDNLDTGDVTDMSLMFYFCSYLTSLDLSSFDTSKVQNMMFMFQFSISLKTLNITNFNTSQVTNMYGMFHHCDSLTEIDVKKFDTSKVEKTALMFSYCENLNSLDVSSFDTSNVINMYRMFSFCTNLTSLDLSNFDTSNNNDFSYMFIEDSNLKELNLISFTTNTISENSNEKYLYYVDNLEKCAYNNYNSKNIYKDCSELIGFKFCGDCIKSTETYCIKNIIVEKKGTAGTVEEITKKFFYVEGEKNLDKKDRACYWLKNKSDENYILKTSLETYFQFKCHESCETCNLDDVAICNECKKGYYILKSEKDEENKICYNNITKPKNYYLKNNSYQPCDNSCSECEEEPNLCISCADNYFSLKNESENLLKKCYKCDKDCLSCSDFSSENSQNCIECIDTSYFALNGNCVIKKYYPEIVIKKYEMLEKIDNKMINGFLENFSLNDYFNGNHITQYKLGEQSITIFNIGKNHVKISDEISSDLEISNLELGNLYSQISKTQNITIDLIFIQMDSNDNKKDVNYLIYNPKTKKYIDLSNYTNIIIEIKRHLKMNASEIKTFQDIQKNGYNILDLKNKFYNDKCVPYSTGEGTDVILRDRVDDIYNYDILQFYENCDYENFNKDGQNVACQTNVKNSSLTSITYFEIDKNEYKKNNKLNTKTNFHVYNCGNVFFSNDGFTNNIGNYLFLVCIFIIIVIILTSCKKSLDEHKDTLNGFMKENYKPEINDVNMIKSSKKLLNQQGSSSEIRLSQFTQKINKNEQIENKEKVLDANLLNDQEINDLKFEDASKVDKRTFSQNYLFIIKKSNPILFIFYQNYDSKGIKIIILIWNFCLNICINQLFFTESTIHKIYSDKTNYKFGSQLTYIVLSTIISSVIITIIKIIILTDRPINLFKQSLSSIKGKDAEYKADKLIAQIKIKYIIFCTLVVILTILFWYYVSCFCAVYKNTQIDMIKNALITFIITLIYPFLVCLIPAFIRIISLSNVAIFGPSINIGLYKTSQVITFLL